MEEECSRLLTRSNISFLTTKGTIQTPVLPSDWASNRSKILYHQFRRTSFLKLHPIQKLLAVHNFGFGNF